MLIRADSGGEKFIPWAKSKLAQWKAEMVREGRHSFQRVVFVDDNTTRIYINSMHLGGGRFRDSIRITAESGSWVEQYPEQDLWSIPSAVLPSMGDVIPWEPVIQHIVYKYPTADPLVYTQKHQLVICRYCRRVAVYEWTETRTYVHVDGEDYLGGTIDLNYEPSVETVPEDEGAPYDGLSLDGLTWWYDSFIYTAEDAAAEYGATTATFMPDEDAGVLFNEDGIDYYGGTITYTYEPTTYVIPMSADPVEDGFSMDGLTWGYPPDDMYTPEEYAIDNGGSSAVFNVSPTPVYEIGGGDQPIITGEYVSHDDTNVTIRATDAEGNTTDTVIAHGLIAESEANAWGYLTDELGAGNYTSSQSPEYTYNVLRDGDVIETTTVTSTTTGEIVQPDGTYGPPNGFPDLQIITTGYYHAAPGYYIPAGEYHKYNGVDEYNAAILPVPEPPLLSAQERAAELQAEWDAANYLRWKVIVDFIQSEIDSKRFGAAMDVAELRPHLTYQFTRALVFPVKSAAQFTWEDASGNTGTYAWDTSYRYPDNIDGLLGFTFTAPTEAPPTRSWTYSVQRPYTVTWDATTKQFTLAAARPTFKTAYLSLGTSTAALNGYRPHDYFALYEAQGDAAAAVFAAALGVYTQPVLDAQMESLCLTGAVTSLAYPAYSAVFQRGRGAYYRLTAHVHTSGGYTATQPAIPNSDTDPLAP